MTESERDAFERLSNHVRDLFQYMKRIERKTQVTAAETKYVKDELEVLSNQVGHELLSRQHKKDSVKMRGKVLVWAGWRCMCCRKQVLHKNLQLDAVSPLKNGKALDWDNVQVLCSKCNQEKGIKEGPEWDFRKNVDRFLEKCLQAMYEERQQLVLDFSRKYNSLHNEADWSKHGFGPG